MSYQPYLISKYATGYDRELQPWLLPNDAFVELPIAEMGIQALPMV